VVQLSPEGTTFVFAPGIYRGLSIGVKKNDTFLGMPGATLDGSEPLTFSRTGTLWAAQANLTQVETVSRGVPCDPALKNADGSKYTVGCTHSRSLYRDGTPLWRVATIDEVGPGKWYFDRQTMTAYISDDPQGASLELGEMPDAFHGAGENVTIQGLTIEKYAGAQQHGAIECQGGNWLIQGNVVQLNHSRGISAAFCDGVRIVGNTISRNGDLGIGCSEAKDAIVEENDIDANNYTRVDVGWEAGGGKWTRTTNLVVRNNRVRDNIGPGLWSDIRAEETLYSGNYVANNSSCGIFYEISRHARIEKNVVMANGRATAGVRDPWLWGAQIMISTSSDVLVEDNTVVVTENGNGVTIIDQNRAVDAGDLRASDNRVLRNSIIYQSDVGRTGDTSDYETTPRNNTFDENTYHFFGAKGAKGHFFWAGSATDWDGFRAAGNEKNSRVLIGQ
jgi:hypothetical protein